MDSLENSKPQKRQILASFLTFSAHLGHFFSVLPGGPETNKIMKAMRGLIINDNKNQRGPILFLNDAKIPTKSERNIQKIINSISNLS
jgi:hypothetical protein